MQQKKDNIHSKSAQRIRDVIRYVQRFKNAIIVIYLDDEVIKSPLFSSHIRDISLIHEAGLKVLIVPGARSRIDEILTNSNISWKYQNNKRITSIDAMPFIKMAAFDVSNTVMTALAADHLTAVIGNWVRARSIGIINGQDYGTAGEIDKLETDSIRTVLANGFIPIFPCIGWSTAGKPYNISSITLAEQIAVHLQADKLFFVMENAEISAEHFVIPSDIGISPEGEIPALNLDELDTFLLYNRTNTTKIIPLLNLASEACKAGVSRVHIVNGSLDGALPCEIFSELGSGTMIYSNNYGGIRAMVREDLPAVMSLMRPFINRGNLLPRTDTQILEKLDDYIVYELDGGIRACAALHVYDPHQAEIAAVAVDESFANIGIGPKLINYLIDRSLKLKLDSIFILTTQASDWFEKLGFISDDIASLPPKRKELWTPLRGSKLFRLKLADKKNS
jgi:amino-acid N-acetyltransferase